MDRFFDRIKREWDENPLNVMIVFAVTATAAAKVIDAFSASQGRRAYARQVDYRVNRRS